MRRWIWILVLVLGLGFLWRYRAALLSSFSVVRAGDLWWIALGLVFSLGWVAESTLLLYWLYRALHLEESYFRLAAMVVASFFLNLVAPTGGVSGIALLAADAHRRNRSSSRALAAGTLYLFFEHMGFLAVMMVGFWVLLRRHRLGWTEITAAAFMVALVLLLLLGVLVGMHAPGIWMRLTTGLARRVQGWSQRQPWLQRFARPEQAAHFAHDLAQGLRLLRNRPQALVLPALLGLSDKFWLMAVMAVSFRAFRVPLSPGTLVAAYMVVHLFLVVSPVPGGLGFAEGALIVTLTSFGFALGDAIAVTLTYRILTFWFYFGLGMLAFRYVLHSKTPAPSLPSSWSGS